MENLLILLHGYGSNGDDMAGLVPYFKQAVSDTIFLTPDAPDPCEQNPHFGYQWFSLNTMDPDALAPLVDKASAHVVSMIEAASKEHNVPMDKIVLSGFSQGAMLSLYTAIRMQSPVAGVLAFSGMLPGELPDQPPKVPVQLIHGKDDPVVPVAGSLDAYDKLTKAGFEVDKHIVDGLEHSIDPSGLKVGIDFLRKLLT